MRSNQQTSFATESDKELTKFTDTIAAKKATLQPALPTPTGYPTSDDKSKDGDSQNTNSTMADEG